MESLAIASAMMEQLAPGNVRARTETVACEACDSRRVSPPSTHVKVLITWLSIFPLVTLGMTGMASIGTTVGSWPTWLRALILTAVVVPTSAYFIVPRIISGVMAASRWTRRCRHR